jgi:hypothetical protein
VSRLVAYFLRVLAALFLVRLVLRFVMAVVRGASRPEAPPPGSGPAAADLVRDRVCNTFLPRATALVAAVHGETAFFCSEACRDRALLQ